MKKYKNKNSYKRKGKRIKPHKQRYNYSSHPTTGAVTSKEAGERLFEVTRYKDEKPKEIKREFKSPGEKILEEYRFRKG